MTTTSVTRQTSTAEDAVREFFHTKVPGYDSDAPDALVRVTPEMVVALVTARERGAREEMRWRAAEKCFDLMCAHDTGRTDHVFMAAGALRCREEIRAMATDT